MQDIIPRHEIFTLKHVTEVGHVTREIQLISISKDDFISHMTVQCFLCVCFFCNERTSLT